MRLKRYVLQKKVARSDPRKLASRLCPHQHSKRSSGWQGLEELEEHFVDQVDGEADDVEEGAFDVGDADVADPFLDAVGAGFVVGVVMV